MDTKKEESARRAILTKDSWRVFRILSEFVEGFETMTELGPSVAIFGSARLKEQNPYYKMAVEVSECIGKKGLGIITGGGPGIMEAANRGAQKAKTSSCGVSIDLPFEKSCNAYIDHDFNLSFRYFFVRKVLFVRYAQAFVVLPGGLGTLDELFEAMTLMQTKKIKQFPIFLMGTEYWSGLIEWMKSTQLTNQCITQDDLDRMILSDDPQFVADSIDTYWQSSEHIANF